MDSIIETTRLVIRQLNESDLTVLYEIMRKPVVMYAWEHGFSEDEVYDWISYQKTRYQNDGYGYFAVISKETGELIGQAGLLVNKLNSEPIVEIGYIFDDAVWNNGYAIEAARACVTIAFQRFGIDKLYATIRPENEASAKVAIKLGMQKIGQYIKTYQGKEMPHDIYVMEKS